MSTFRERNQKRKETARTGGISSPSVSSKNSTFSDRFQERKNKMMEGTKSTRDPNALAKFATKTLTERKGYKPLESANKAISDVYAKQAELMNMDIDASKAKADEYDAALPKLRKYQGDRANILTSIRQVESDLQYKKDAGWDVTHDEGVLKDLQSQLATIDAETKKYASQYGFEGLGDMETGISNLRKDIRTAYTLQTNKKLTEKAMNSPEFETKNAYGKTTEAGVERVKAFLYLYPELTMNNAITDPKHELYGGGTVLEPGHDFYEAMSEDEKKVLGYYLENGETGEAREYLESIQESVGAKVAAMYAKESDNWFDELMFSAASGADQFASGLKGVGNAIAGKEGYVYSTPVQQGSALIRKNISERDGIGNKILGGAYDLTQTTANMLPSVLVGMVNPTAGAVVMGASAGGNAYNEMINLGYSANQARAYGLMVGASETLLERFLGGVTALRGTSVAAKLASKIDNAFGRAAITIGADALSEFTEETLQTYLEPWFKSIVTDLDYEAPDIDEALYAGLLGALSAGMFNGGTLATNAAINKIQQTQAETNLGETLLKTENPNASIKNLIDNAQNSGNKKLERTANKVAKTEKDGAYNVSARKVGKLTQLSYEQLAKSIEDTATGKDLKSQTIENLTKSGMNQKGAERAFDLIARDASRRSESKELQSLIEKNPDIRTMYDNMVEYLSDEAVMKRVEDVAKASPVTEIAQNLTEQRLKDAGIEVIDESGEIDNFVSVENVDENGNYILERESGETYTYDPKTDNMPKVDKNTARKVYYATNYLANGADAYVKLAPDGEDLAFDRDFETVYNDGLKGRDFAPVESSIPEDMQRAIYNAGKSDLKNAAEKSKREYEKAKEKEAAFVKKQMGFKSDRVTLSKEAAARIKSVSDKGISDQYEAAVKVIDGLAKMLQVNINIVASETDANGKYIGANGRYNRATNTFTFDIMSGMDNVADISYSAMVKTAGHELTHFIQNWSPSKYLTLKNTTLKFLKEENGADWITKELRAIQQNNKAIGDNLTLEQAKDELVADAFEDVLGNIDFAETVLRTDKTLFDKIHSWVKKHASDFKKNLGIALKDVKAQTEAGKTMKAAGERAQALYNEWADAFSTALENSSSGQTDVDADVQLQAKYSKAKENIKILEMIEKINNGQFKANDKVYFDNISNVLSKKIFELTGVNTFGFKVAIEARQLEHILIDHGPNGKSDQSMSNPSDIAKIEYVIHSPDEIGSVGRTQAYSEFVNGRNRTAKTVKYEKNIGDKTYFVVQAVPDTAAKTIYIVTAYMSKNGTKKRASQLINAKSPNATSENGSVVAHTNMIPQEDESVKQNSARPQRDSEGNKLTEAQQEYFKDSKVRDENGNLKVMYHGTPSGKFTVFKDGTYFTENKWYADLYQNPGASSISTGKVATDPKTYEVYLDIKKPFDINDAEARKIYINDYIKGGNAVGINPYLSDAEYAKIRSIDWTEGEDLRDFLNDNGYDYDGLVLDEGAAGGYGEDVKHRGKSYVIFSPEQVKNADNTNPTSDPDIRNSARNISRTNDIKLKKAKATIAKDFVESMSESPQKAKLKVLANNYAKQIRTFEKEQKIYIEATANGNEEIATVAYAGMTLAEVAIDQIETDVDFASMINENATREKLREMYNREGELMDEIHVFEADLTDAQREVRESERLAMQFAEREKQATYRAKQIELRNQRDRNTSMLLKEKTRLKSALEKPTETASVPKGAKPLADQVLNLVDALNAFNGTSALTRPSAELIDRIMKMSDDAEKLANGSKSKSLAQRVNSVDKMMRNATYSVEQVREQLIALENLYKKLSPDDEVRGEMAEAPSAAESIIYDKQLHDGLKVLIEYFNEPHIVLESGMFYVKEGLKMVRAMNHQLLKANQMYVKGKSIEVLNLRNRLFNDVGVASPFLNKFLGNALVSELLTPKTMIHIAFGATDNADVFYNMMDDGQMRYIRFINGAKAIFAPVEKEIANEKFKSDKATLKTGLKYMDGTEVLLNYEFALSLIKIVENADSLRHAVWGGLQIPDLKPYNKGDKKTAYNGDRLVEHAQPEDAPEAMSDEEIAKKLQDAASKGTELTNEDYLDMYAQQIAWCNRLNLAAEIEAKYKAAAQMLKEQMSNTEVGKQALKMLSAMTEYYDVYARKYLNEATMELYGFEKTLQEGKTYYPIRVRSDEKATDDNVDIVRDFSLENWGSMKHRVNSKKGIELFGAVTELESYMENTAKYYAWTNVTKNMKKILNTQIIDDNGTPTTLVGKINKLYGSYDEKAKWYNPKNKFMSGFEKYMKDLQSEIVGANKGGESWTKLQGAFVTNALLMNISTPLVQYSALPLVAVDSGYLSFIKTMAKGGKIPGLLSEAQKKYVAKYSEVYRYRSGGLINVDLAAAKANKGVVSKALSSKALAWTESADSQVLGKQFYAILDRVKRTHKGISAEEAASIAGKQLDQTIYEFQANYTVLQRSPVLRGNGIKKFLFGTFRTQQITMLNAMIDSSVRSHTISEQMKRVKKGSPEYKALERKRSDSMKRTAKIHVAIALSNALNAFIRMGVGVLRRKDDEEKGETAFIDFLDSYFSMIPFFGDIASAIVSTAFGESFYGEKVFSLGMLDTLSDSITSAVKIVGMHFDDEDQELSEYVKELTNVLAVTGVPARNIYNIIKMIMGWAEDAADAAGWDWDLDVDEW